MVKFPQAKITTKPYSTQPVLPDHNLPRSSHSGSLGLFSFAFTTLVLGIILISNPGSNTSVIAGVGIFYGGITQFVVGYLENINGNSFSGAVFSSYGALWVAKGLNWLISSHISLQYAGDGNRVLQHYGVIEAVSAGLTFTFCAISVNLKSGSRLLTGILAVVGVAQIIETAALFTENTTSTKVAGIFLVVAAAGAWYAAVAELVLDDGILLPVGAHSEVMSHPHPAD